MKKEFPKTVKFEEHQVNYIKSQSDEFSEWVRDAVNEKIKKREQLPDTLFFMGIFIKEKDITEYIKKTILTAKMDIKPDESKDSGIISFKLECLPIDYEIHFFYHMIYLKGKESFYNFEMVRSKYDHEFYADKSGTLTEIDVNENELCKFVKDNYTGRIQDYQPEPNDRNLINGASELLGKL